MVGMSWSLWSLPFQAIWDSIWTSQILLRRKVCRSKNWGFFPYILHFLFCASKGWQLYFIWPWWQHSYRSKEGFISAESFKQLTCPPNTQPNPLPQSKTQSSNFSYNFKARLRWYKSHLGSSVRADLLHPPQVTQFLPRPALPSVAAASLTCSPTAQTNTCIWKDLASEELSLQSRPQ